MIGQAHLRTKVPVLGDRVQDRPVSVQFIVRNRSFSGKFLMQLFPVVLRLGNFAQTHFIGTFQLLQLRHIRGGNAMLCENGT